MAIKREDPHLTEVPGSGLRRQVQGAAGRDDDFLIAIDNQGDSVALKISGDLDLSGARRLREAAEVCLESRPDHLVLDAADVTGFGLAGIGALGDLIIGCREKGTRVRLVLNAPIRRVLDAVGLWWLGVVDEVPRPEEAIQAAKSMYGQQFQAELDLDQGEETAGSRGASTR